MWNLAWPILLVVGANTFYNISAKSMPGGVNAFASLAVTYLVGFVVCIAIFFITANQKELMAEISKVNWTSFVLGISAVALEFGYISIYRAGWKIGTASLVANIGLACVLVLIGLWLYKETVSPRKIAGIIVCGIGLFLIGK